MAEFTILGASLPVFDRVVLRIVDALTSVLGVGIMVLGLVNSGVKGAAIFACEHRFDMSRVSRCPRSGEFVGMAVAFS